MPDGSILTYSSSRGRGSKDGDDRIGRMIDEIARRVDDLVHRRP
jgi:hypothetical protein